MKSIEVIIPTFNGEKSIGHCIRSIYSNIKEPKITVVDNASIDGTVEYVSREFPKVRVIQNEINTGFGRACNSAALDSDSELAILLNQDAEIKSLDLPSLESLFSNNDVAMAGGRIYSSNGQHIDSIGKETSLLSFFSSWALLPLRKLGLNLGNRLVNGEEKYFKTQEVPWNYGPLIVVKTSVFQENGGFDRRFFMYVEEVELSKRIRKRGFRVMFEPTLQAVHESPNMRSGLSTNTVYHTLRGQRIFLSIHGNMISPFLFQLFVPTTCIVIGLLSSIMFFWSQREYKSSKALLVGGIKALLNPNFKSGYK